MATRWYTQPNEGDVSDVSPTVSGDWDGVTSTNLRRKLVIDTPANISSSGSQTDDIVAGPGYYLNRQCVSEPLDVISATF